LSFDSYVSAILPPSVDRKCQQDTEYDCYNLG